MAAQRAQAQAQAQAQVARTVAEVTVGLGLQSVAGRVTQVQMLRPIEEDLDDEQEPPDFGPKARDHEKVFMVTFMCAEEPASCGTQMKVYFYDAWSEKCKFLTPGDLVVITCAPAVVCAHPLGAHRDEDDHACCLTLEEGPGFAIEVCVPRRGAHITHLPRGSTRSQPNSLSPRRRCYALLS